MFFLFLVLLNVYLVDVVSGSVVFSMMHRKVRPPLHVVHSENWLAYAHYNDKVRRTEISKCNISYLKDSTINKYIFCCPFQLQLNCMKVKHKLTALFGVL